MFTQSTQVFLILTSPNEYNIISRRSHGPLRRFNRHDVRDVDLASRMYNIHELSEFQTGDDRLQESIVCDQITEIESGQGPAIRGHDKRINLIVYAVGRCRSRSDLPPEKLMRSVSHYLTIQQQYDAFEQLC